MSNVSDMISTRWKVMKKQPKQYKRKVVAKPLSQKKQAKILLDPSKPLVVPITIAQPSPSSSQGPSTGTATIPQALPLLSSRPAFSEEIPHITEARGDSETYLILRCWIQSPTDHTAQMSSI